MKIFFVVVVFCLFFAGNTFDKLINPKATNQTLALYQKLIDNYDKNVFSGQTTFNYDDFVAKTGFQPIVRGFDMQNYSPHNPWYNWQPYDDGTTAKAISWYLNDTKGQGIVIFFWHWFSPMGGQLRTSTFYTSNTDFDVTKAVVANTAEYNATIRDFDAIAVQLKKLQSNKVPVLWRPLHAAGGKWFWWGAKTNTAAIKLYNMMYDRFTNYHLLNNLIWVWSSPEPDWYPGNLKVDIMGYGSYPGAYNYGCRDDIYAQLKNIVLGAKMIQLTQTGPIPNLDQCMLNGVKWGLFMSWNELTFPQNTLDHIKAVYNFPFVKKIITVYNNTIDTKPINLKATNQTLTLYKKLVDNYDKYVFSGQTTFNYDDFVSKTGFKPIVRGFDMQNYSPNNPWYNFQPYDDGTTAKAISWYLNETKGEGIVYFFWHWFSPMGGYSRTSTFYTSNTDFDVTKAVVANTAEYNATIRDFDAIAVQLKKLQSNKVPVLWRPLHEAGGKWFWWGAKTNTAAIQLYNMMYDRFTNYHLLNNLIWVWSTPEPDWYPGNLKVDIMGYDSYPGSYNYGCNDDIYAQLKRIVQGAKMIQLTQNGPIPNFDQCMLNGVKWGVFMSWSDLVFSQNSIDHIKAVYNLPFVRKIGVAITQLQAEP